MDTSDKLYIISPYDLDMKVNNSHRHLIKALYSLVEQRPFDTITVKDICQEANVSRSNFYNHFVDKYHLLLFYINMITLELKKRLDFTPNELIFDGFLLYIQSHGDFVKSLVSFENGHHLHRLLESAMKHDLDNFLWARTTINLAFPQPSLELHAIFLTGGITSLIQWWVLNDFPREANEISKTINDFLTN